MKTSLTKLEPRDHLAKVLLNVSNRLFESRDTIRHYFSLDNSVKRKPQENFRRIKTVIDLTNVLSSSLCNTVQCTYHSVEIHEFLYHNYFQQSIKKFP